jgi:hypothetical protein
LSLLVSVIPPSHKGSGCAFCAGWEGTIFASQLFLFSGNRPHDLQQVHTDTPVVVPSLLVKSLLDEEHNEEHNEEHKDKP